LSSGFADKSTSSPKSFSKARKRISSLPSGEIAHSPEEPCLAVVSRHGKILYSFSSDEVDERGFKWLGNRDVPEKSKAMKCVASRESAILADHSHTGDWFSERRAGAKLWEESVMLGSSGYVLTLLTWPEYKPD
jgi:hypothetical protein